MFKRLQGRFKHFRVREPPRALGPDKYDPELVMPWCCDSEPEVDDDVGSSLCDSESVCDSELEARWDSEAEVSETDFALESEGPGSEAIKSGSRSKTAVESTTYRKTGVNLLNRLGT